MAQIKVKETGNECVATFLDRGTHHDVYYIGNGGKEVKTTPAEVEIIEYR